ncbi:adenosylcobinamide kinase [Mariprofundus aestuarium]|uniref:Bifunctional adenosylcobalamin biosynthesis protein n=1 Tax=Mariprofundus aestuarium TaxID=1921086 RepID=A0A2K8KVB8_MARES|nr:bifunctional adenosylcobinamide kinase/adenosylcobinamide-phosphate guanylyltransferase [Mariprofundus aestuarium]ATX78727.1 adenosylcobinamide kinase [Mariprofundus aestuarium]
MPITLILGGARSGKSRHAEELATSLSDHPIYVATAPLIDNDHEWLARIERHREERDTHWQVIEEELALTSVLKAQDGPQSVVLIDCLTLWLSNLIFAGREIEDEVELLCELLPMLVGEVILVANEVGMGLVPENPEGRAFRDAQGRLNQRLAATADRVEFIAAGLPICLK